jgi:transcriptional regulator with XRE-family HTH domain
MSSPGGTIYAIGAMGTSYVKIGSTRTAVERRLKVLQTGQPFPLQVLASVPVEQDLHRIEKQVRALLEAERRRGAWFDIPMDTPTLEALIVRAVACIAAQEAARNAANAQEDSVVNMQTLGERVLLRRRRAGLSQSVLAHRAGVDTITISRLERGQKKRLELETAARLAHGLDLTLDQFCGLEVVPTAQSSLPSTAPCPEPDPALERFKRWNAGSEAQQTFVAHLLHWHEVEGMSIQALAQRLNAAGIPTRSGRGQWFQASVSDLLLTHTVLLESTKARKAFLARFGPGDEAADEAPAQRPRTRKAASGGEEERHV